MQEILRKQKEALVKERARSAFWEIVPSDEAEVATSNEFAPVSPLKDVTKVRWLCSKHTKIYFIFVAESIFDLEPIQERIFILPFVDGKRKERTTRVLPLKKSPGFQHDEF